MSSRSAGARVGWGVAYGLFVWVLAELVVLPLANPVMNAAMSQGPQPFLFAAEHVVFGAVLGWYLATRRP